MHRRAIEDDKAPCTESKGRGSCGVGVVMIGVRLRHVVETHDEDMWWRYVTMANAMQGIFPMSQRHTHGRHEQLRGPARQLQYPAQRLWMEQEGSIAPRRVEQEGSIAPRRVLQQARPLRHPLGHPLGHPLRPLRSASRTPLVSSSL